MRLGFTRSSWIKTVLLELFACARFKAGENNDVSKFFLP